MLSRRQSWGGLRAIAVCAALAAASFVAAQTAAFAPNPAANPIPAPGATPDAQHVVVVANSREPESEPIARYYMKQRGIPDKNLVLIDAPTTTDITWTEFVEQVFNPLRARLVKDGWLSAYATDQKDVEGRFKFVFFGNKIDFLVVCYGVPVRIANDPARLVPTPLTLEHKELNTNQAAVDSELSLLAAVNTPTTGLVNNPLYDKLTPDEFTRGLVVKVARLDGPTPAAVRGMIDSARAGEAHGLQGRAYIDFANYGATDARYEGELWLKNASATLRPLGFDISEDHESSLFSWRTRFDAPAIYLGWYAEHPYGPISAPDFKFPPGAIAIHIHSFSAENIRNANSRWVGPLIMRGVAATVGNVFEPYLHFTHHLDLFMDALAHGKTTGEAAYYSLPALSWQEIFVGDPLYHPFAVSLDQQLAQANNSVGPGAPYAVLRQMNLLQQQDKLDDALALGRLQFDRAPTLAFAFALAQIEHAQDRDAYAKNYLTWAATPGPVARGDEGILAEMARWAVDRGDRDLALDLYAKALAAPNMTQEFLQAVLPEALVLSQDAGNNDLRDRWQKQFDILNPPKTK